MIPEQRSVLRLETYTAGHRAEPLQTYFAAESAWWQCEACGAGGHGIDHVVVRGEASLHNMSCGVGDGDVSPLLQQPYRAQRLTSASGAEVIVTGDTWRCLTCGDGSAEIVSDKPLAHGAIHVELCGTPDPETDVARLIVPSTVVAEVIQASIEDSLADKDIEIARLKDDAERAEGAAAAADSEREDIIAENKALVAAVTETELARRIGVERADIARADGKASSQVQLLSLVGGGAAALVAALLGNQITALPGVVQGLGAGTVVAAMTTLGLAASVSWPARRRDDRTQVTVISDLESQLSTELSIVAGIADEKFKRLRWATLGLAVTVVLAVITVVTGVAL